ncbi:peptidylprolyl isomerase [Streptomyces nodosus]|uniref:peptidylprolyl isomerase n=1 Tax=Streptomyces nodosus TaxID=40318 RepID=UPI0036E30EDF
MTPGPSLSTTLASTPRPSTSRRSASRSDPGRRATSDRNGSQLFISYADPQAGKPEAWTPFGTVLSGLDVLKWIGKNGTRNGPSDGRPKKPVITESVTVRQ